MLSVTSHIFHDASKYFNLKLEIFHELYCDSLLAMGFPKAGKSLLEVDFSTSDKYSEDLFQDMLVDLTYMYSPNDDANKDRVLYHLVGSDDDDSDSDEDQSDIMSKLVNNLGGMGGMGGLSNMMNNMANMSNSGAGDVNNDGEDVEENTDQVNDNQSNDVN